MTNRPIPWDEIRTPDADYNVRRIAGSNTVALYWGKDVQGHCLFVVELEGDHSHEFRKGTTAVHGIRVDLRQLPSSRRQGLVLTLEQHINRDLFFALCETLTESLRPLNDSAAALTIALTHLKRWKAFLSGRRIRILSPEEIRGLFAELRFLRSLYTEHLSEAATVEAWCGPNGVHQDFVFGNTAVEIKALSGKERNTVRISSEDQLQPICDNLFLAVFRLSEMSEAEQALSLNDAVRTIEAELQDAAALEELSLRLAAYGYVEMREYDEPKLIVTGQRFYRVTDGFPRLIRSELPDGVTRVAYEIELETIAPFECEAGQIRGP